LVKAKQEIDTVTTRVIKSQEFELEGARFSWWAVGDQPMLVTVRSDAFGSTQQFAYGDVESFAQRLARGLLRDHRGPS
jgi:hypothetical protein